MNGQKRIFSDEEVKYIIENWGKESPYSMKKKFGCTWYAVCKVAEANGLELPKSNEWTEKEIELLKELSEQYHYADIADMMGKTENAIYLKARRLGITLIQDRRKWIKEEEIELQDLWGNKSIEFIAKKLKRTVFSIKVKAIRMGIGPMIKNNYELLTISDICESLQVSRDRIINTWFKLGLKMKKKKLTKNMSYYTITLKDLMDFLELNQNEWDSRNLEPNLFGSEPNWLIEKRKKDEVENPLWYRRWTEEEIKLVEKLFKSGKSYEEIGKIVERSDSAIASLLRNMGYSYRLPHYWKGNELKYLKENYQNMTYAEIAETLGRTEKAIGAKVKELGYQKKLTKKRNGD